MSLFVAFTLFAVAGVIFKIYLKSQKLKSSISRPPDFSNRSTPQKDHSGIDWNIGIVKIGDKTISNHLFSCRGLKMKNILGRGAIFGLLFVLGGFLIIHISPHSPFVKEEIKALGNALAIFGFCILGIAALYCTFGKPIKDSFNFVLPLDHFVGNIQSIAQCFEKMVKASEHNINCLDEQNATLALKQALTVLYGSHSVSENGIVQFLEEYIIRPYSALPYKKYEKKIIAIRDIGTDTPFFAWECTNSYTICNPTKAKNLYLIEYRTGTFCHPAIQADWIKHFKLDLWIDGVQSKDLIGPPTQVKEKRLLEDDTDSSYYRYYADDQAIMVYFRKNIELSKRDVPIRFVESSLNPKDDHEFFVTIHKPALGQIIDFSVPKGYKLRTPEYLSSAYYYAPGKEREYIQGVTKELQKDTRIEITCEGWQLPGLICHVKWDKIP